MLNEEANSQQKTIKNTGSHFPVVGIGASAGGLPAFETFFTQMPSDSHMAFVLVQHLSPDHESILSDLIQQYTTIPVYDVTEGMQIAPNRIYIIPPNREMVLQNGKLYLGERTIGGAQFPIDHFFRSLAKEMRELSIGILLSGSGTDGMEGIKAIKSEGGMAMAQDLKSSEHGSMSSSAISTGLVDFVLSPGEMPVQLVEYISHLSKHFQSKRPPSTENNRSDLQKILDILHAKTGHNFSYYKQNTICRRIERRMAVKQIDKIQQYILDLEQNPIELESLFQEFLIGVTHFFRDMESFELLKNKVIPSLFTKRKPGENIRVWVPGCSTGEEAYSIAILFKEYLEQTKQPYNIQIFASDIDTQAIGKARIGKYPANIAANISQERLSRFFNPTTDGYSYQIDKNIREMVVFAEQNVAMDPPFSRLDLISCRNLLIYFDASLQKKVLEIFHYALNYESYLFLGSSETIGQSIDTFAAVDKKSKLYQRKGAVPNRTTDANKTTSFLINKVDSSFIYSGRRDSTASIRELVEQSLLQQYAPACVIINKRSEILYIHGRTSKYLELQPGEAKMNILLMAREGLRLELNHAINKVIAHKETVQYTGLSIIGDGQTHLVNLTVSPVQDNALSSGMMMVVFQDITLPESNHFLQEAAATFDISTIHDEKFKAMEQELLNKEEYLQTTIEELETSNEELQSTNEELQSTNEELETSKEELQSVNEELVTVNTELTQNIDELTRANNDINNMLSGTGVGTIFLDDQLRIQRFTPVAAKVMNLIQNDIGRPVHHIASNLMYDQLNEDITAVLDTLAPKTKEVQAKDGMWYLLRILPYRTLENIIEGAVITLIDISEQKQAQRSTHRLAVIVRDSSDAITMHDLKGQILAWNPGAEKMYEWSEPEALRMNIRDIHPERKLNILDDLDKRFPSNEIIEPFRTQRVCRSGKILEVWMTVSILINEYGEPYAAATIERLIEQ